MTVGARLPARGAECAGDGECYGGVCCGGRCICACRTGAAMRDARRVREAFHHRLGRSVDGRRRRGRPAGAASPTSLTPPPTPPEPTVGMRQRATRTGRSSTTAWASGRPRAGAAAEAATAGRGEVVHVRARGVASVRRPACVRRGRRSGCRGRISLPTKSNCSLSWPPARHPAAPSRSAWPSCSSSSRSSPAALDFLNAYVAAAPALARATTPPAASQSYAGVWSSTCGRATRCCAWCRASAATPHTPSGTRLHVQPDHRLRPRPHLYGSPCATRSPRSGGVPRRADRLHTLYLRLGLKWPTCGRRGAPRRKLKEIRSGASRRAARRSKKARRSIVSVVRPSARIRA